MRNTQQTVKCQPNEKELFWFSSNIFLSVLMTASFLKFIYTGQGNWKIYSEHCQQQQRGHGLVSGRAEPQLLLPPMARWICFLPCSHGAWWPGDGSTGAGGQSLTPSHMPWTRMVWTPLPKHRLSDKMYMGCGYLVFSSLVFVSRHD